MPVWRLVGGPVAAVWDVAAYGGSFGEDDLAELAAQPPAERLARRRTRCGGLCRTFCDDIVM